MIFNENGVVVDLNEGFAPIGLLAKKKRLSAISKITNMDDNEAEKVDKVIKEIYERIAYSVQKHARDARKHNKSLVKLGIAEHHINYNKYNGKEFPCIPMFKIANPLIHGKSYTNMKKELIDILNSECNKENHVSIDFREGNNIDQVFLKVDIKGILTDVREDEE